MRTILTRALLLLMTLGLVACFQHPVDFGDPSVLRGALSGIINSNCQVHVYQIAWSSDGKKFATLDNRTGGRLTIWDNDTGTELSFVDHLELNGNVQTMTWTTDNKNVIYSAYINQHSTVFTYNIQTGASESSLILEDEQNYWISHISLSGHRVLGYLSDLDQNSGNPIGISIRVWDTLKGKKTFSKHFDLTRSASFALSKNGEEFAIWVNGTVQIWSIASGLKKQEWKIVGDFLRDLTYNFDDLSLSVLVGFDGVESTQFVRFNKSSPEAVLQTKVKSVAALRFNGDGTYASVVIVDSINPYLNRLINLETGVFSELPAASGYSDTQRFSPDGKALLFAGVGSCAINRLTIADSEIREFVLQALKNHPIQLQISAVWQDKNQYSIVGSANLDDQKGLTVKGTGYSGDQEYYINPRTPVSRPSRAILEIIDAKGFRVGVLETLNHPNLSNNDPNYFSGTFRFGTDLGQYFNLQLIRQP
jgi:hypothetical protein